MIQHATHIRLFHYLLSDNGIFPNSAFPVLFYKSAFHLSHDHAPKIIEDAFQKNHWTNSWRNGIYTYHHYHSTAHEVLGIYSGDCHIQLGGERGIQLMAEKGDAILIPAGVAHKNIGSSMDFKCVGAYDRGKDFDINLGRAGERPQTDKNISKLPLPSLDPVFGKEGGLNTLWEK